MSTFKEDVKSSVGETPNIETSKPWEKVARFTSQVFNPDSLEAKSDKVIKGLGDPHDRRSYGRRMEDELLSMMQSNTLKHNSLRYEVDFGGEATKQFQKMTSRGRNIIRLLDDNPKNIKKEMDMFEKMDATVGLSDAQKQRLAELEEIYNKSERIFVTRGKNDVLLRSAPDIEIINLTDAKQGGITKKEEMDDVHPNVRTYFFSEIENIEIRSKQRMVDQICYKTGLDKNLFYKGVYQSCFDDKEKPRFNRELIEEFIKPEYRVDSIDYELTRVLDKEGNLIDMPETKEEIEKGEELRQEALRLMGGRVDDKFKIEREFANYNSIPDFVGKTPDDSHLKASLNFGLDMWINGRSVKRRDLDYAMEQVTQQGDFQKGVALRSGKFMTEQVVRGASFRVAGYPVEGAAKLIGRPQQQINQGSGIIAAFLQQAFGVMSRGVQTR